METQPKTQLSQVPDEYRIPDSLWERLQPLLPSYRKSRKGGRNRANLRQVLDGIFFVLRTGCQWKALRKGSTYHRYFQEWIKQGIFRDL